VGEGGAALDHPQRERVDEAHELRRRFWPGVGSEGALARAAFVPKSGSRRHGSGLSVAVVDRRMAASTHRLERNTAAPDAVDSQILVPPLKGRGTATFNAGPNTGRAANVTVRIQAWKTAPGRISAKGATVSAER
jgi:hypothetical protein